MTFKTLICKRLDGYFDWQVAVFDNPDAFFASFEVKSFLPCETELEAHQAIARIKKRLTPKEVPAILRAWINAQDAE